MVAYLYPGYKSYKTLSQRPANEVDIERWLMYWSVIGCVVAIESAEWVVNWSVHHPNAPRSLTLISIDRLLNHVPLRNTIRSAGYRCTTPSKPSSSFTSSYPKPRVHRIFILNTSNRSSTPTNPKSTPPSLLSKQACMHLFKKNYVVCGAPWLSPSTSLLARTI